MGHEMYSGCFAGLGLRLSLKHPETYLCFDGFLHKESLLQPECPGDTVTVPREAFQELARDQGYPDNAYTEFELAVYYVSDALLRWNASVIHAAALYFEGAAWLFAAESGTGKSTQLRNWMSLYPEGSRIMNGDKPVLRVLDDGKVMVYPSPWRGKELWGDDGITAPLGGVVLLRQGKENRLSKAEPFYHAARLLSCFFSRFETEESVRGICRIEEKILQTVPVWELVNTGDNASTVMIHEAIMKEIGNAFP